MKSFLLYLYMIYCAAFGILFFIAGIILTPVLVGLSGGLALGNSLSELIKDKSSILKRPQGRK